MVRAARFLVEPGGTLGMKGARMTLDWNRIAAAARPLVGEHCKACVVCDGRACKNAVPGPGAKGVGDVAMRNYAAWRDVRVNMDTICASGPVSTSCDLLGRSWSLPLFIGPVGDVNRHYGPSMDTLAYNRMSLAAARAEGVAAFTGDGVDRQLYVESCGAIREVDGLGVPTVKPWGYDVVADRMNLARESGAFAVAMDVDASGLPFLKGLEPPAGSKSVEQLREIAAMVLDNSIPFIVKGVMTPAGALKAVEAGATALVVSNHGGRVLDGCPATAEVLPSIVRAVEGRATILVDGGIRSGLDVFRALALGAQGVLVCRPFVVAAFGAGEEGIRYLLRRYRDELADAMEMCGARCVGDITKEMIWHA